MKKDDATNCRVFPTETNQRDCIPAKKYEFMVQASQVTMFLRERDKSRERIA